MFSDFLQFGFLGLVGLLITLCYKIVSIVETKNRPLGHTLTLLGVFTVIAISGGSAGYLWASKELEVMQAKESITKVIESQINNIRKSHVAELAPLQKALDDAVKSLEFSSLNETRNEHLSEITRINEIIDSRKHTHNKEIEALSIAFNNEKATNKTIKY